MTLINVLVYYWSFFVLLVFTVSATNINKPLTLQYVLNFGMNLVLHHLSCGHGFISQIMLLVKEANQAHDFLLADDKIEDKTHWDSSHI